MLGSGDSQGSLRPGAMSDQVLRKTEQKLIPAAHSAGDHFPARQGYLKRGLSTAIDSVHSAVDAADSGSGDMAKRLKVAHKETHRQQDWQGMGARGNSVILVVITF